GVLVTQGIGAAEARRAMAGFLRRRTLGRPHVTLKLATSLDGCIALASGESRWITGAAARAHAHLERSRHDAIVVGRGTLIADAPMLDVRLAGLEARAPRRYVLSSATDDAGLRWRDGVVADRIADPAAIAMLPADHVLVEGGARTAAAFLTRDLVDRLLLYRAPILIGGGGKAALGDIGLAGLAAAHRRWVRTDMRQLGSDVLEVYERTREGD
ncbi:MAG TPA: RibD family protein, partial [Sphingomonas sp.]|nr:RibD family protein [Sphingomonas sp.]